MRFSLLLVTFLVWGCRLNAQLSPQRFVPPQYTFEHLPMNAASLDHTTFYDAIEDQEGYLWLSGTQGLHVYDGKNLISYSNDDPAHPIRSGDSSEVYATFWRGTGHLLWLQEYASNGILCFDSYRRKMIFGQRTWLGLNGLLNQVSTTPSGDLLSLYVSADWNQSMIFKGWQQPGDHPLWLGKLRPMSLINFFYTSGFHWLISISQIIRISGTDNSVKSYHLPATDSVVQSVATESGSLYMLDSKSKHIYTWDAVKDSFVIYMNLPRQMHGSLFQIALDRQFVYIGNYNDFYMINRTDGTIQDLSGELQRLRSQEGGDAISGRGIDRKSVV